MKNLKIYLRQIYRNSLKTYNNQAMRLLREECRHEFWASYEPASDNSGGKPENSILLKYDRYYPDAPYHFVDTEQEFQTLVKGLRP